MADQFNHHIDVGGPPLAVRRSYAGVFGVVAALAVIAGVSGLLWLNYDHLVEVSSHTAIAGSGTGEDATVLKELQAIQQQTSDTLLATRQLLEAQQAEMKRLSDQVASLTDKIDQLQPRPALPPAAPTVAARPAPKKPPAPKPAGAISVGGAPLPAPAQPAR